MILFNLPKELVKPLHRHIVRAPVHEADLVWRCHAALIGTDTCIVAQEQYSQYIMVFCGVTTEQFANFPQYFTDRFWREAAAICKQADLYDSATLRQQLQAIASEQVYRLDPEPLEEGKLIKVMEKLERRFLYDREPLPVDGRAAFTYSYDINSRQPTLDKAQGKPTAAEAFGDICLNLIDLRIDADREKVKAAVVASEDNIITVDFGRNRDS
ncbi:hypothetical protein [Halioxenophilus sp. WMMB6]|uniref:hypothetical protein n=1 Tax=Halioxenophilus sp. WMMB6 TaxID=3073815 RepID=UPI00295EF8E8|nr:hypothetical protein [Halioxenophilus sp. WMMB6]